MKIGSKNWSFIIVSNPMVFTREDVKLLKIVFSLSKDVVFQKFQKSLLLFYSRPTDFIIKFLLISSCSLTCSGRRLGKTDIIANSAQLELELALTLAKVEWYWFSKRNPDITLYLQASIIFWYFCLYSNYFDATYLIVDYAKIWINLM